MENDNLLLVTVVIKDTNIFLTVYIFLSFFLITPSKASMVEHGTLYFAGIAS